MYDKYFEKYFSFTNFYSDSARHLPSKIFTVDNLNQSRLKKIRILLVDDHRMVREGLRRIINTHDDMIIVGEAADGKEAVELAREIHPDIILMDVNMPVMNGIEATRRIIDDIPKMQIIGLSMNGKDKIIEEMKSAGASTYLKKSEAFESLVKAIRDEVSSY